MAGREIIGKTIDRYRIDKLLGQGGMAAVYEATDTRLQRKVAIKIMHPHLANQEMFQQQFLAEARLAARLDHPNIVRVLSFDHADKELFLVMDLIPGGSLRHHIKTLHESAKLMGFPEVVELVRQVAEALNYASQQNMAHRDMKPDNILLKPIADKGGILNYQPIVTDFGLAKLTISADEMPTIEQPIGTYPYMSPEQTRAEQVDGRTDIYSLGIMLYELAVGRLPFQPKTIVEAMRMHNDEQPPLPTEVRPGFPVTLERIIFKCLEKNPNDRYQNGRELALALAGLQAATEQQAAIAAASDPDKTEKMGFVPNGELPIFTAPPLTEQQIRYDRLLVYSEEGGAVIVPIRRAIMTIGRGADQNIQLGHSTVSRRHARVERGADKLYRIIDLESSNGTWVNGNRLESQQLVVLEPGQVIQIGHFWITLELKDSAIYKTLQDDDEIRTITGEQPILPVLLNNQQPVETPIVSREVEQVKPPTPAPQPELDKTLPPVEQPEPAAKVTPPIQPEPKVTPAPQPEIDKTLPPVSQPEPVAKVTPPVQPEPKVTPAPQPEIDKTLPPVSQPEPAAKVTPPVAEPEPKVATPPQQEVKPAATPAQPDTKPAPTPVSQRVSQPSRQQPPSAPRPARAEPELPQRAVPEPKLRRRRASSSQSVDDLNRTQIMRYELQSDIPYFDPPDLTPQERQVDRIVAYREGENPRVYLLTGSEMNIGRDTSHQIHLTSNKVSRHHGVILRDEDGQYNIMDVGSTNGTFLGDAVIPVDVPIEWNGDDVVRIGDYWLTLEYSEEAAVRARLDAMSTYLGEERGEGEIELPKPLVSARTYDAALIGKTVGNYDLLEFLGKNSISSVYKAQNRTTNQVVALKIIHPYLVQDEFFLRAFFVEAPLAKSINHPNVVSVINYEQSGEYLYIVMELVNGPSLRKYMDDLQAQGRSVDIAEMADFARQIADGMYYAHQQGLYHRDLHPGNIVLRETLDNAGSTIHTPVLTDFALAEMVQQSDVYVPSVASGEYVYLTPERTLGKKQDERSDVYELGIVMYETLTGRPPYEPHSLAEATRMHTRMALEPPSKLRSDTPTNLERILTKALAKDPQDRYQNANDLSQDLREVFLALSGSSQQRGYRTDVDDLLETAYMPKPLPPEMPYYTPQPFTEQDARFDRLIVYSELFPTRAIPIDRNVITIGRGSDQKINLESNTVSRQHARIERGADNAYRLIDMGSTNKTYLNNETMEVETARRVTGADTIRIGEYWIRIEKADERGLDVDIAPSGFAGITARDAAPVDVREPARKFVAVRDVEREGVVARPGLRLDLPPPAHDRIGLIVHNPRVTVVPGSTVAISIEVINQSELVDHFTIEVDGLPKEWVHIPPTPLYLLPNNRGTTSITITPPLASSSTEGEHAFGILAHARAQVLDSVTTQCAVDVEPFRNFVIDFQPLRVSGRGRAELKISNTGNTYDTYTLDPRDREAALDFVLPGKQFTMPPGKVEYVPMRVKAKHRPFTGPGSTYPFEIQVHSQHETVPPKSSNGEYVVTSRFPLWFLGCLGLLLLLACGLIAGGGYFTYYRITTNQTAVAGTNNAATQTQAVINITETAIADTDGDQLSNMREATLQSDPLIVDTDGDGLTDGDEARVWQTTPIARDSDGDTLTDGDEVNIYGTNPLNPDTDGDGIGDAEDTNPVLQATATVTPFPTAEGGCPGSPVANLALGDFGRVTEGGVNNRLRDNPGVEAGEVIGLMPPGVGFTVIGGPVCDPDQFILWWEVDYRGTTGWTASGEGEDYYVEPAEPGSGGGGGGGGSGGGSAGPTSADEEAQAETDAVIAALPEADATSLDRSQMGVQVNPDDNALARTSQIGVSWVKVQVNWAMIQPAGSADINDNFRQLQQFVRNADAAGLNVLVSITKAPDWARSNPESNDGPPDNPEDLALFLTLLLREMGSSIDAIEVWNEPNLLREWDGTLPFTGEGYMQLFEPAYKAIRTFSPDITIVTAGLAPTDDSGFSVNDRAFLNQMYASGLADFADVAIGVHPFGWGNDPDTRCCDVVPDQGWDESGQFFFINTLEDYHSITVDNGHDVDLWATEFGWGSWEGLGGSPVEEWMSYNTLTEQSDFTVRAFQIGQALDYMGPMFLWNLNFANADNVAQNNEVIAYSMFIVDSARPLFNTLAEGQ